MWPYQQVLLALAAWAAVAALLFFPSGRAAADTPLIIDADAQYRYATHSYESGAYRRAVEEYQRFIYFFPSDLRVEAAMFNSGMAYFRLRLFAEAVDGFRKLIEKYGDSELALRSYLMVSESYVKAGTFDAAIINLQNLLNITRDVDVRDEAHYRLGWIYIETAAWEKARTAFAAISGENRIRYRLERLSAELDREGRLPRKDPTLAGLLSIVPGAGQLYVGRQQDALVAFLVNAGLIMAAYEAFDREMYALGAVVSFVEIGFYAGNIYGAVSGAHKFNRKTRLDFIEELKRNSRISLSADPQAEKWLLSVRVAF